MTLENAPVRIAMWSGPRNISTAMMRAFENRPDTVVCDEPMYAHYLNNVDTPHPIRDAVIASQPTDWRVVAEELTTAPLPGEKSVYYQKHMTHHFIPGMGTAWMAGLCNCFLIREPREMLTSLLHILPEPVIRDTGVPQQWQIFEVVREQTGTVPPVLDAKDVLENPRRVLSLLCEAVGIPFDEAMLSWPPGPRDSDGVWGPHWYGALYKSTGFQPYKPKPDQVPAEYQELLDECNAIYEKLYPHRLK